MDSQLDLSDSCSGRDGRPKSKEMKPPDATDHDINDNLQFDSESSKLSYIDSIRLYEDLQSCKWQQNKNINTGKQKSWRSRQVSKSSCNKTSSSRRKFMPPKIDVFVGGEVCNCAASCAADCTAVCCCPCALVSLLILAVVKLPIAIARKTFFCAKKMVPIKNKSKLDEDGDERIESSGRSGLSWSCGQSPQASGAVYESSAPKIDSEKLWSELYAEGRMGFVGIPLERN